MNNVGVKIKELRKMYNMSQEELGNRLGIKRAAVQKYEKGTVENIPIKTIERIASIFDVTPTYILGWDLHSTNSLPMEAKILQGIQTFYGSEVVELIEIYCTVSNVGKKRLLTYAEEVSKLY